MLNNASAWICCGLLESRPPRNEPVDGGPLFKVGRGGGDLAAVRDGGGGLAAGFKLLVALPMGGNFGGVAFGVGNLATCPDSGDIKFDTLYMTPSIESTPSSLHLERDVRGGIVESNDSNNAR